MQLDSIKQLVGKTIATVEPFMVKCTDANYPICGYALACTDGDFIVLLGGEDFYQAGRVWVDGSDEEDEDWRTEIGPYAHLVSPTNLATKISISFGAAGPLMRAYPVDATTQSIRGDEAALLALGACPDTDIYLDGRKCDKDDPLQDGSHYQLADKPRFRI